MEVGIGENTVHCIMGMMLGGGFAVATVIDAVAFIVLATMRGLTGGS